MCNAKYFYKNVDDLTDNSITRDVLCFIEFNVERGRLYERWFMEVPYSLKYLRSYQFTRSFMYRHPNATMLYIKTGQRWGLLFEAHADEFVERAGVIPSISDKFSYYESASVYYDALFKSS